MSGRSAGCAQHAPSSLLWGAGLAPRVPPPGPGTAWAQSPPPRTRLVAQQPGHRGRRPWLRADQSQRQTPRSRAGGGLSPGLGRALHVVWGHESRGLKVSFLAAVQPFKHSAAVSRCLERTRPSGKPRQRPAPYLLPGHPGWRARPPSSVDTGPGNGLELSASPGVWSCPCRALCAPRTICAVTLGAACCPVPSPPGRDSRHRLP